jgi:hypothetical protein
LDQIGFDQVESLQGLFDWMLLAVLEVLDSFVPNIIKTFQNSKKNAGVAYAPPA